MVEFAQNISDTWNISTAQSIQLCEMYGKGLSPYYLCAHVPAIAASIELPQALEIFEYLRELDALSPKKKRLLTSLRKRGAFTDTMEKRIRFSTSAEELDDMLIACCPSPHSKGQTAERKGLGEFADILQRQEATGATIEELAGPFVGKDPSLKTTAEVIDGARDLLAERFAGDTTVRSMARDFGFEDGYFEIVPRSKNEKTFAAYAGRELPVRDLSKEEFLRLHHAEQSKSIRLKVNVQLFRVTELLRQHFIIDPDSAGFDLICEAIDAAWARLLHPIVERDIKNKLFADAERWALREISRSMGTMVSEKKSWTVLSVWVFDRGSAAIAAVNGHGRLLGATSISGALGNQPKAFERITQFFGRHKPTHVIFPQNENAQELDSLVRLIAQSIGHPFKLIKYREPLDAERLADSEWMKKECADLDRPMQCALALSLVYLNPPALVPKIGVRFFTLHPLQKYVREQQLNLIIQRTIAESRFTQGIGVEQIETVLPLLMPGIAEKSMNSLAAKARGAHSKNDLESLCAPHAAAARNIAAFIVFPESANPLDTTLVHPENWPLVEAACADLRISPDYLIGNPEALRSYVTDDPDMKLFIEKHLIAQLAAGQKFSAGAPDSGRKPKRKLKLAEVQEGALICGKVTNIKPFGVFVDINAVCDGLIHISQLSDVYVETPEQIVAVNDTVTVRILKVDPKKRRISLSMKNLGDKAPRVAPSQRQLATLSSHFQNR
jgi:uncharacterized protein